MTVFGTTIILQFYLQYKCNMAPITKFLTKKPSTSNIISKADPGYQMLSNEEIAEAVLGGDHSSDDDDDDDDEEEIPVPKPKMVDLRFYVDELLKHVDGHPRYVASRYDALRTLREELISEQYDRLTLVRCNLQSKYDALI